MAPRPTLAPTSHRARPLRADARRNRERIVVAAAARRSPSRARRRRWTTSRARAGVGVGTRLPALPHEGRADGRARARKFARVRDAAREALDVEDPWEAFAGMLRATPRCWPRTRRCATRWRACPRRGRRCEAERAEVAAVAAEVIGRAQAAGVLRTGLRRRRHPDAHVRDVRGHGDAAGPRARLAPAPGGRPRRAAPAVGHRRIVPRSPRGAHREDGAAGTSAGRARGSRERVALRARCAGFPWSWRPPSRRSCSPRSCGPSWARPRRGRGSRRPSCCSARPARC